MNTEATPLCSILNMDLASLRKLKTPDVGMNLVQEELRHIFEVCGALWLHSGDPSAPHAELTSGRCSNGFVDVLRALRYANLCEIMADQLVRKLGEVYHDRVDWALINDLSPPR